MLKGCRVKLCSNGVETRVFETVKGIEYIKLETIQIRGCMCTHNTPVDCGGFNWMWKWSYWRKWRLWLWKSVIGVVHHCSCCLVTVSLSHSQWRFLTLNAHRRRHKDRLCRLFVCWILLRCFVFVFLSNCTFHWISSFVLWHQVPQLWHLRLALATFASGLEKKKKKNEWESK